MVTVLDRKNYSKVVIYFEDVWCLDDRYVPGIVGLMDLLECILFLFFRED